MAGIQEITEEILQDAKNKADALLAQARQAADRQTQAAEADAAALLETSAKSAEAKAKAVHDRASSQAGLAKRNALLTAKQGIIDGVIQSAYEKMKGQDDAAYFETLLTLLKKSVQPGAGEIALSAKDLARLPVDFEKKAGDIAQAAGGKLALSPEPVAIDAGFVLRYGGIEENCSLAALFAAERDALQDRVHEMLRG